MIRKSLKEEKAITLVALIITIIVLLILAMVSIRLVMNGGIIDRAERGTKAYTEAEIGEQLKLVYAEYQMGQYQTPVDIEARLKEIFGNDNVQDVSVANGKLTAKINGTTYEYDTATGTAGEKKPTLADITKNNYGDYIDLRKSIVGTESTADDWRILYNDKANSVVYAILADYLPNSNPAVIESGLNVVEGKKFNVNSNYREDLYASLNNISKWKTLIDESLKNINVKGAVDADILTRSYNEKYGTNYEYRSMGVFRTNPDDNSSQIDSLYMPRDRRDDGCYGYLLSNDEPSEIWRMTCGGYFGFRYTCTDKAVGLCPITIIPSNIQATSATSNGVTIWSLAQ